MEKEKLLKILITDYVTRELNSGMKEDCAREV